MCKEMGGINLRAGEAGEGGPALGTALHPRALAEALADGIHGCLASLGLDSMVLHKLCPHSRSPGSASASTAHAQLLKSACCGRAGFLRARKPLPRGEAEACCVSPRWSVLPACPPP